MKKLLISYIKELTIASRGLYFYIEIGFALIVLFIILFVVSNDPPEPEKEFVFYDVSEEVFEYMEEELLEAGEIQISDSEEFEVGPSEFEITDENGNTKKYVYDESEKIKVQTYEYLDTETDEILQIVYIAENEEDLIRLAEQERKTSAVIGMNEKGEMTYKYYLQGYETEKLVNLMYVIHNDSLDELTRTMNEQTVISLGDTEQLSNKGNILPLIIVFSGALMGFFIVMSYVFHDKNEGVINAFAVSPGSMGIYLLGKSLVALTTGLISTAIVTIPIMGLDPNYFVLVIYFAVISFAFSNLGLFIASFFDNIAQSFGVMYVLMVILMVPAFSYLIPSFDPVWIKFFPTYPALQGMKDILLNNGDFTYVWVYSGLFIAGGLLFFWLSIRRFRKTLSV
jgi:hypothetical protein